MRLKCPVVAALPVFSILAITCSGHTTHYIKPTPDTTCPAEPCLTLSEYAQQPHNYLTSNTTLLLLPGDHVLSVNFEVENVRAVEICAQLHTYNHSKSRVLCEGLAGFTFTNVSTIILDGLTFWSCGKKVECNPVNSNLTLTTYGVSITLGEDISIVNCTFKDSIGTALGVFYSSLYLTGNSFTSNCNGHLSMSNRHGSGTKFSMNICAMFIAARKITQPNMMEESHQRRAF